MLSYGNTQLKMYLFPVSNVTSEVVLKSESFVEDVSWIHSRYNGF